MNDPTALKLSKAIDRLAAAIEQSNIITAGAGGAGGYPATRCLYRDTDQADGGGAGINDPADFGMSGVQVRK